MISKEKKLEKINEFIKECDKLLSLNYREGEETYSDLSTKLRSFLHIAFDDSQRRINECFGFVLIGTTIEKTEQEKQKEYEEDIKQIKRNLDAYKEEIEMEEELTEDTNRLDKLQKETEEKKAEAERRKNVAETKAFGGLIEVIDTLRDELKRREQTDKAIIELKKDIQNIKSLLKSFVETYVRINKKAKGQFK